MDCTLCLDCAKACPHDNVAWSTRTPGEELFNQSWPHRLDLALLAIIASFVAFLNAYAMTPPVYAFELELAALLGTSRESIVLGLIYIVGALLVPLVLVYGAALLSRTLSHDDRTLSRTVMNFAYTFVPLGFAIWLAHYLFHFITGAMTLVPTTQLFFESTLGIPLLGPPNWEIAGWFVPSISAIQSLQVLIMFAGAGIAVAVTWSATDRDAGSGMRMRQALPWLLLLALVTVATTAVFQLPMEMRGSALGG